MSTEIKECKLPNLSFTTKEVLQILKNSTLTNGEIDDLVEVAITTKTSITQIKLLSKGIKIDFTPREPFKGFEDWFSKNPSVIFVESEELIDPLLQLLIKQDVDWKYYRKMIKVLPNDLIIKDLDQLNVYCEDSGKTTIYDIPSLQKQIPFIIYQDTSDLF